MSAKHVQCMHTFVATISTFAAYHPYWPTFLFSFLNSDTPQQSRETHLQLKLQELSAAQPSPREYYSLHNPYTQTWNHFQSTYSQVVDCTLTTAEHQFHTFSSFYLAPHKDLVLFFSTAFCVATARHIYSSNHSSHVSLEIQNHIFLRITASFFQTSTINVGIAYARIDITASRYS